jgi:hypothetical protein
MGRVRRRRNVSGLVVENDAWLLSPNICASTGKTAELSSHRPIRIWVPPLQQSDFKMGKESGFKQKYPLEVRKSEADKMLFAFAFKLLLLLKFFFSQKYPDRIPVICEKAERSDIPGISFIFSYVYISRASCLFF